MGSLSFQASGIGEASTVSLPIVRRAEAEAKFDEAFDCTTVASLRSGRGSRCFPHQPRSIEKNRTFLVPVLTSWRAVPRP